MYEKVLSKAKTIDQREKMKEEIDLLTESLYVNQPSSFENTLSGRVREDVAVLMREEIASSKIDKRNYLNGLLEALTGLDVVKLTLAFEPTSISIDKFWSKIVEITGRHVLLDIFYKPRILGGAHISFGGEYKDFSLEKALDAEIDKGAISILSVGLNKEASNSKKQSANAASAATKA